MSNTYEKEAGIAKHLAALCKGSDYGLQEFGKWALGVLKNIPSNAIVESRFSTAAQVKSSTRMSLLDSRLQGVIMLRDEPTFEDTQFDELLTSILQSLGQAKLTNIKRKRGRYKKT